MLYEQMFYLEGLVAYIRKEYVCKDSENQCTGNCSDFNITELKDHSADTGNEDNRSNEKIAVFVEVNALEHFETGNSDKSVKCDTDTAHYTVRNCFKESNKW